MAYGGLEANKAPKYWYDTNQPWSHYRYPDSMPGIYGKQVFDHVTQNVDAIGHTDTAGVYPAPPRVSG